VNGKHVVVIYLLIAIFLSIVVVSIFGKY